MKKFKKIKLTENPGKIENVRAIRGKARVEHDIKSVFTYQLSVIISPNFGFLEILSFNRNNFKKITNEKGLLLK